MNPLDTNPEFRGRFHLTPPVGWMNDPNGFSWFDGQYHLFYQHHPWSSNWGPMHWGHAVSPDLLQWEHRPIALAPDQSCDAQGCFSGTAVEHQGQHVLMYTGHLHPDPADPASVREVQNLAFGNGTTYTKLPSNPIIGADHLPPGASARDFRDPKLWQEDGTWYCLLANQRLDGGGQLLLYRSPNLTDWTYVGAPLIGNGGMLECPDLFQVDGQEVLLWSALDMPRSTGRHQNCHSVLWSTGRLDRGTGDFTGDAVSELDYGTDFYAPQTVRTPDGRIILQGWLQMWHRSIPTHDLGHGWAGRMALPREVSLVNGRLLQNPIRELEACRGPVVVHQLRLNGRQSLPGVQGQYLDLEVDFTALGATGFGLDLFVGRTEFTRLTWQPQDGQLVLDRRHSGQPITSHHAEYPDCNVRLAAVDVAGGPLKLRLILDRSSLEIFAQDGATVLSTTVYPEATSSDISFFTEGGAGQLSVRAWELEV